MSVGRRVLLSKAARISFWNAAALPGAGKSAEMLANATASLMKERNWEDLEKSVPESWMLPAVSWVVAHVTGAVCVIV